MRIYNNITEQIENKKYIETIDGIMYPDKISESELNSYGYYMIVVEDDIKTEYQNSTEVTGLILNKWTTYYTYTDKIIDDIKLDIYTEMKASFDAISSRPNVDVYLDGSLAFVVNGGRDDVTNFEVGKKYALPQVKDINGVFHYIVLADYDTIIDAIQLYGISLYQKKWVKEESILSFTTIQECSIFKNEPVDINDVYTTTEADIVRYRNNITEW